MDMMLCVVLVNSSVLLVFVVFVVSLPSCGFSQRAAPSVRAAADPPSFLPARHRWRQRQQLQSVWQPGGLRSPGPADDHDDNFLYT